MFLGSSPSLCAPAAQPHASPSSNAAHHDHGSGEACSCGKGAAPPLMQSMDEMDFERGLWGLITRGGSAAQCAAFLDDRGSQRWADRRDRSGYTPLLYAARGGDVDLCALLIDRGASVNAATPGMRQTPLHRAAQQGHARVVELLLKAGADAVASDASGVTPAALAEKHGHVSIAQLLKQQQQETPVASAAS